ncbi:MAG: glycosyltransferase family 4 protein [Candidatus Thorarchaeota archaeon]
MVVHQYYHRDPRVRRYAETLAKSGIKVDIICPRYLNGKKVKDHKNIRIFTIPLKRNYKGRENYIYEYILAFLLYFIRINILFFKNRYHIIHIHNMPDFLIFTAFLPKILGTKLILDIHDLMPEAFISKYKVTEKNYFIKLMKIQERISARFAHVVITANSNFKNNLVKRGITFHEITVINNIADTNIFDRKKYQKNKNNKHFTLIYPGTVAPRYGLDVAIRALPFLSEKIPNLKLIIIGTQVEYTKELKNLIKELNVIDNVQFISTLPIEEIPQKIINADIGIYTAISDIHIDIATPTKVIEYAIMGIPIVATRLKVLEDLFDPSSIMFFESGNVEGFSDCIMKLYNNPSLKTQLVQNADHNFVNKHSWEQEKNKYYNLLNSILKNGYKVTQ